MKMKNQKVVGVSLWGRIGALAVVLAMLFSAVAIAVPSNVRAGEPVNDRVPMMESEQPHEISEPAGPWIVGNITVDDGSFPESVTIKFTNQRTGENAVDIARDASYMFDLKNFTMGCEVGDSIAIEALENTGDGKINSGSAVTSISANNKTWADILLIDPPPYEPEPIEPLSTPTMLGNGIDDNTTYTEPILIVPAEPGTRKLIIEYNIALADIDAPEGFFYENVVAPLDITLGNIGDRRGDIEYLSTLHWAAIEVESLLDNTSIPRARALLVQAEAQLNDAILKTEQNQYVRSVGHVGVAVGLLIIVERWDVDTHEIISRLTDGVRMKVETVIFYGESIYGSDSQFVTNAWLRYNDGVTKQASEYYVLAIAKYECALVTIMAENRYTMTVEIYNIKPDGNETLLDALVYTRLGIGREETKRTYWTPDEGTENIIKVVMTYSENDVEIVNMEEVGAWVIPEGEEVIEITPGMTELPEHHGTTYTVTDSDLIIGSGGIPYFPLDDDTIIMASTTGDGDYQILVESDGILEAFSDSWIRAPLDTAFEYRFDIYGTLIVDHSTVKNMWGNADLSLPGGIVIHPGATVEIRNDAMISKGKTHNIYCAEGSAPLIQYSNIVQAGAGHGIIVKSSATPTILGNTFTSNYECGLYLDDNTQSLTISGNTFDSNYEGLVADNSNAIIQGNTITGNSFGIDVRGTVTPTITGNTITYNVGATIDEGVGIFVDTASPVITSNTIEFNKYGIYFSGDSTTTVTNNPSVNFNTEAGVYLINSHGSSIRANPSIANNKYGIYLAASASTIDDNTISSNTLDGIYGTIYTGIGSNPLIRGNIITLNLQNGIFINQATVTIENNIINNHVNGAGIRVEQSTSPITIQTNPSYSATRQTFSMNGATSSDICMINSQGSVINNLISGRARYGIYLVQSSPTITQNEIEDHNTGGWGWGIFIIDSSPQITSNDIGPNWCGIGVVGVSSPIIEYNYIFNIFGIYFFNVQCQMGHITDNDFIHGHTAILIYNSDPAPLILKNTIIGTTASLGLNIMSSSPYIGENTIIGGTTPSYVGIFFDGESTSSVHYNIIQNCMAYGIYTRNGATPAIVDNTITNNGYGIYMIDAPAPTTPGDINVVNTFSDSAATKTVTIDASGTPDITPTVTLPKGSRILDAELDLTGGQGVSLIQEIYDSGGGTSYGRANYAYGQTFIPQETFWLQKVQFYYHWPAGGSVPIKIYESIAGSWNLLMETTHNCPPGFYGWGGTDLPSPILLTASHTYLMSIWGYDLFIHFSTNNPSSETEGYIWSPGTDWIPLTDLGLQGWDYFYRLYRIGYPEIPKMDVGNDGTNEWEFSDTLITTITIDNTNTKPPLTQAIQAYLDAAPGNPGDPINIPLAFSADSAGKITLSNLKIIYGPAGGSAIVGNDISSNDNVGIELHDSSPNIYDNLVDSNYYVGIGVYEGSAPIIDCNRIQRTPSTTSFTFKGIDVGDSSSATILTNTISDHGCGVFMMNSHADIANGNVFTGNQYGIAIDGVLSSANIGNSVGTRNSFEFLSGVSRYGIYIITATTVYIGYDDFTSSAPLTSWSYAIYGALTPSNRPDIRIEWNNIQSVCCAIGIMYRINTVIEHNTILPSSGIGGAQGILVGTGYVSINYNIVQSTPPMKSNRNYAGIFVMEQPGMEGGSGYGQITWNEVSGFGTGIGGSGEVQTVDHNSLENNGYGVWSGWVYERANLFTNNLIINNDYDGLFLPSSNWNTVMTNNEIHDNGGWGIHIIGNNPTNAGIWGEGLIADNPLLGNNGAGMIWQERYVRLNNVNTQYQNIPAEVKIWNNFGELVFDWENCYYATPLLTQYKRLNGNILEQHTPHTIEAWYEEYGEVYIAPVKADIRYIDPDQQIGTIYPADNKFTLSFDANKGVIIVFDQITDTSVYDFANGENDFSLSLIPDTAFTASSLASAITGCTVVSIQGWDEINQDYVTYPGTDFDIKPDYGYIIEITGDASNSNFVLSGARPGHRTVNLVQDWNLIGWTSYEKSIKVSTFKTLLSDPAAFDSMYYWDGTNWQTMNDNSLINPGNAYFVKMNYAATLQYSEPELVHEGPPVP